MLKAKLMFQNYKSVSDFLKDRRKKMKDKYKADDSWIEYTESNRKQRISKMKTRAMLLSRILKIAIDFPIDDQIGSTPILGNSGTASDAAQIGGLSDESMLLPDFEGKPNTALNHGYADADADADADDYIPKGCANCGFIGNKDVIYDVTYPCPKCHKGGPQILTPKETSLYGLPDGINDPEDLDAPSNEQSQYGTTNSGNTFYNT
jgi:hypothetical protein